MVEATTPGPGNPDPNMRPPGNPWTNAPPSITRLGYAVLVLLSVAASAYGLFNGNLVTLVLTAVICFGFFIALFSFGKIAGGRGQFWPVVGKILGLIVLSAITALFCLVLYYIPFGQPVLLDVWLRPGYIVDKPTEIEVTPGAASSDSRFLPHNYTTVAYARYPLSFVVRASHAGHSRLLFVASDAYPNNPCLTHRLADLGAAPSTATSLIVSWNRDVSTDLKVEISYRPKGSLKEFSEPTTSSGTDGRAKIGELSTGTVYEIKVVNNLHERRSDAVIVDAATDAFLMPIGRIVEASQRYVVDGPFPSMNTYYTGRLDRSGTPNADTGQLLIENWVDSSYGPKCWSYIGGIKGGLPSGSGRIETFPYECNTAECGSVCEGNFVNGEINYATCDINIGVISVPRVEDGARIIYSGPNKYKGEATGSSRSISLWPFAVGFSGNGRLEASDRGIDGAIPPYLDVYNGFWTNGVLVDGTITRNGSVSYVGDANKHADIQQTNCLIAITPSKNGTQTGPGGRVTCGSGMLGFFVSGSTWPLEGFTVEDNLIAVFQGGKRIDLDWASVVKEPGCLTRKPSSLLADRGLVEGDWRLTCVNSQSKVSCDLSSLSAGLSVASESVTDDIPRVTVRTGVESHKFSKIRVDDEEFSIPPPVSASSAGNYLAVAAMCSGKKMKNVNDREVDLSGFCPQAGLMFARLRSCQS